MRRFHAADQCLLKEGRETFGAEVSLHFAHYNFVRVHRTLRVTPAMEARVSDRLWSLDELVEADFKLGAALMQTSTEHVRLRVLVDNVTCSDVAIQEG